MPFFSVIIPLYNKEDFIADTIKSVLNQTFTDFEIIVVNDGSTDDSKAQAQITLKNFKNATLLNQENQGLSASRNRGISSAKGEIVTLIDADDLWNTSFLECIHELYSAYPKASFYGTDYLEKYSDTNIQETKKNIDYKLKNTNILINDFFITNTFQHIVCQSSIAFKKEISNHILFDETITLGEDIDFYLKCFINYDLVYSYTPLAIINCNIPNQITKGGVNKKTLPDLDKYEKSNPKNLSLKKYLDFYRYFYASQYKLEKNRIKFKTLTKQIDFKNLSLRQKILLKSPRPFLMFIKYLKKILLKFKIRLTSFS
ncbi:glycosyltransferase family 2 protein [Algibacter sp. TI.3.09]|uniref:glycosyltransferase family 2 protein n=1 Tax=Algibacter sp. TI.3.09 TaxID=3121298 RepID=UPI00312017B7